MPQRFRGTPIDEAMQPSECLTKPRPGKSGGHPSAAAGSATRRAFLARAGLSAASLAGLAGCRLEGPDSRREIVYWTGWSGHEYDILQELIGQFNREHPGIRARMLTQFSTTGSYQKVRIAFAGGATPDLMSTVWAHELAGYALRGVLEPLDDWLRAAGRDAAREFSPGIAQTVTVGGRVFGLAMTTNARFIAYNKRLFREGGLDPERPPRTIAELDEAAARCTLHGPRGELIRCGFRPQELEAWAYSFGGQWFDGSANHPTADHPGNVAALEWMASYGRRYDLRKIQALQSTYGANDTPNGPFYIGKMAMWTTGEWAGEFVRRFAPGMEWGWFALPSPPGGRSGVTAAGGSIFVIPAASRRKAQAWALLDWLTRAPAVKAFCSRIGNVPPLKEAARDAVFQKDPLFRFASALVQGAHSFGSPPNPIWPAYRREITRVEEAAMLGGQDPRRLLGDLQHRMERERSRTCLELGIPDSGAV